MKRLILELSLKPFRDHSDEAIREVCREILRQWETLYRHAETISFLLWTADGSEILEYDGDRSAGIEWAKWLGIANGPWTEDPKNLHTWRWPYVENPPRLTYERLEFIVRTLKEEGWRLTGKNITVGATFDPGPEFAESAFKYNRHREISGGDMLGEGKWVNCGAVLRGDDHAYAGYPDGIPNGTTLGTFLGRQSEHFLTDLGFDYLWFSNGFGFALAAWNVTGEVFDEKTFDTTGAPRVREAILRFWTDFRRECREYPIETRGSNLSTGMDLSAHASPVRDIYRGGFNLTAPVNSPWACMNGDYGLELVGWMSHIAELPENGIVPFRFYIHDPWWANSPWLDRHGREPNDIYLPLSLCRIGADGEVTKPESVALLTIDDSYGRMPELVPNEVTPHIQRALLDFPDAPGLVTWIYPFDEYHEWTFGEDNRVNEVFFGDWFMRAAVNQGFPLNTVVTTGNFLEAKEAKPGIFGDSILVCPAPDAGSELAGALMSHLEKGGKVLLYGPLHKTDEKLLGLLNLKIGEPISGDLNIRTSLPADILGQGAFPDKFRMREMLSGGGAQELRPETIPNGEVVAEVEANGEKRAFAATCSLSGGGRLGWVRGAFCEEVSKHSMLPFKDDLKEWFSVERLMRAMLEKFQVTLHFTKPTVETLDPLILAARVRGGWTFSGFSPSTNVRLKWRLPEGVPIPVGCDVLIEADGGGTIALSKAWHRECRVLIQQAEAGEVCCVEKTSGAGEVERRLLVTGLKNAAVTFLHDSSALGARVRFQKEPPYPGLGEEIPSHQPDAGRTVAHGVSGTLLISQYKNPLPQHLHP
ncbi:hypothetical protein BH09VER1_BH09VER1_39140 [soil metagenome]